MVRTALFLLLLHTSACCGFGFRGCSQNTPATNTMWCTNNNIANLSEVVSMIPENITIINMSRNKIRVIPPGSFSRVHELRQLDLSHNRLVPLKGGEFRGLYVLDLLNLTYNNISHVNSNAFEGLTSLKILLLSGNSVRTISPGIFSPLPKIQEVDLSLNKLRAFSCAESGGSSTLRWLSLFANNIQSINVSCFPALKNIMLSNNTNLVLQADVFASNPRLRTLLCQGVKAEMLAGLSAETKKNLSSVAFSLFVEKSPLTICGLLKGMDNLERVEVDLQGSKLPRTNSSLLDCATPASVSFVDANLGNVSKLSLGKGKSIRLNLNNCGLTQISQTTFDGYPKLQMLQLNKNKVQPDPDAFKGLTDLRFISFDSNKMRDVDPNWFIPLKQLIHLSAIKNEIAELTENVFSALAQLEQLHLQFNLLKYITKKPFKNLWRLKTLNLSFNIIDFIEEGSFGDLMRLEYLDMSGNRIKRLTPRILSGLTNLKEFLVYNNWLNFKSYESPFTNLSSLEYLEMNYQGPGGGGIGSIGPHFFKGADKLKRVRLGHSIKVKFHTEVFVPLVSLEYLTIEGVDLKMTNLSTVLSPLKTLKKLILRRTDLDVLPVNLLPPNNSLRILEVSANHLHTVDKAMLDALPRLHLLDVTENPISCSCDNAWFKNWAVHNADTQVYLLYNLQCDNDRKSPYLWEFDDKACSYDQVSFTLFLTCSVADVLFVCVCLAWKTHGSALRYLLLILKTKVQGHRGAGRARFQYDAFISYSSKDEAWVMKQLVPNVEMPADGAPGLRLCLHHRNFRPGAAVMENIEAAIYNSRHTICVVTRSFLRSEWCSVEFQLASLRLLFDGSDVLLLVFLEEIPEYCLSPYTRLRKLVKKKTYLLWPEEPQEQEAFWVRLRDAIKDNREDEEEGVRGGEELAQLLA